MVKGKKAISGVVATILIILITVAGVTIVWTTVIPMIQEETEFGEQLVQLDIETASGYTVWDSDSGLATVQIERGADNINFSQVQIIINCAGDSDSFNVSAPEKNQAKVYKILSSCEPESVSVAPILGSWKNKDVGEISSEINNLPEGNLEISINDILFNKDGTVVVVECLEVSDCDDSNECTEDLCTDNVCSNGFEADGTSCGGVGEFCDGQGNCGVCSVSSPCDEQECKSVVCNAGSCDYTNLTEGAGCSVGICDGGGYCAEMIGNVYSMWPGDYFDWTGVNDGNWLNDYVRFEGTTCIADENVCEQIIWVQNPDYGCWNLMYNCIQVTSGALIDGGGGLLCGSDKFYIYETAGDCWNSIGEAPPPPPP
tara:strand:+ start:3093 stop:4205 length:1113 start_codon:yes stop_codon:yes gene_type:complete